MDLRGSNVANFKKNIGKQFTEMIACNILLQMLTSIENVHRAGFIHRDIKPSNFVMGRAEDADRNVVYLVDFGLAKEHIDHTTGRPFPERKHTDFRGTIPYASLSAHLKKELGRKDDLWSLYFVILEFFDNPLPWKSNTNKDEVRDHK
jgi:tau tubulin kinase